MCGIKYMHLLLYTVVFYPSLKQRYPPNTLFIRREVSLIDNFDFVNDLVCYGEYPNFMITELKNSSHFNLNPSFRYSVFLLS